MSGPRCGYRGYVKVLELIVAYSIVAHTCSCPVLVAPRQAVHVVWNHSDVADKSETAALINIESFFEGVAI